MGDSALFFRIVQSVDNAWGVTYLYGCTALMISDPKFVIGTHHGGALPHAPPDNRFVCPTLTDAFA